MSTTAINRASPDYGTNPEIHEKPNGNWNFKSISLIGVPTKAWNLFAAIVRSLICIETRAPDTTPEFNYDYRSDSGSIDSEGSCCRTPYVNVKPTETKTEEKVKQFIIDSGFKVVTMLGEGSFGHVYAATYRGRKYAIKTMAPETSRLEGYLAKGPRGEGVVLGFPEHENLVQTYGIFTHDFKDGSFKYRTDKSECSPTEVVVGIQMEYVKGAQDLFTLASGRRKAVKGGKGEFSKSEVQKMGRNVAKGLAALHGLGILHRDVKQENVVVGSRGQVKQCDFGFARYLSEDSRAKTYCGTVGAMSPEQIRGEEYDSAADVWAFGILMWELANGGRPAFDGRDTRAIMDQILSYKGLDDLSMRTSLCDDEQLRDLVSRCLQPDPENRPSMEEVLKHPFFNRT